jgi:hypothetical protein
VALRVSEAASSGAASSAPSPKHRLSFISSPALAFMASEISFSFDIEAPMELRHREISSYTGLPELSTERLIFLPHLQV